MEEDLLSKWKIKKVGVVILVFEKIDFKILSINNDNSLSVFKDSIDFDHNKR